MYEFKSNGTIDVGNGITTLSYSVNGNVITTSIVGVSGTIKYKIDGNKLTLFEQKAPCILTDGTFYK